MAGEGNGWNQYVEACSWWIFTAATRPRPFLEKMVLFWHGHLVSAWSEVDGGFRLMRQLQTYRANALGNFVVLAQQMAIDPAMLVYLSNAENRISTKIDRNGVKRYSGSPNQNFARELLELFTLGVGNCVPVSPRRLRAVPASRQVTLSWRAPQSNGGATVSGYRVTVSQNGRKWSTVQEVPATTTSVVATGLNSATTYRFRVAAMNAAGSDARLQRGGPDRPELRFAV
jgi:hypothetical protein